MTYCLRLTSLLSLTFFCAFSFAQDALWKPIEGEAQPTRTSLATTGTYFQLSEKEMRQQLKEASDTRAVELFVPLPNGQKIGVKVWETQVLPAKLARKYPMIRTFGGHILNDPSRWVRLDMTYEGFHATFQTAQGIAAVYPQETQVPESYLAFYMNASPQGPMQDCQYDMIPENIAYREERQRVLAFGPSIQTRIQKARAKLNGNLVFYRLAVSATGEYTANHGGTKAGAMSAITTSVNNLNAIVGRDVSVQFQLVPNNDNLVFLNAATDPFNPGNAFAMLDSNINVTNRIIGAANYDLGHVVTHGLFGGLAYSPATCLTNFKAGGYSSNIPSTGPRFDINYLAHEVGHQLGAPHNFSATSCSNVELDFRYEPGSGTTIMCYAGTCAGADNVQQNSDAMYHIANIAEMFDAISSPFFGSCVTTVPTSNALPVANAGAPITIPRNTKFTLVGSATDGNNTGLTYSWEQLDGSGSETAGLPDPDSTNNALFRTLLPTSSSERTFPRFDYCLCNPASSWEVLPNVSRDINFGLIVRDNNIFTTFSAGDIDIDTVVIPVDGTKGPLELTRPCGGETLFFGNTYLVTWDVNSTDLLSANVHIEASSDSGKTWPLRLATHVANDGSESIVVPNTSSGHANFRVRSAGTGHYFFDDLSCGTGLCIISSPPLPASIENLTSTQIGASVRVAWEMDVPDALVSCVIQRKQKGQATFVPVHERTQASLLSGGDFFWNDEKVSLGQAYVYRLDWVDTEGTLHPGPTSEVQLDARGGYIVQPNPTTGVVFIQTMTGADTHTATLFNVAGKVMDQVSWTGLDSRAWDLSNFPAGMYVLHLQNNEGIFTQIKILKYE